LNVADRSVPYLTRSANPRGRWRIYLGMHATSTERRQIGKLEVSLTGLGCNNFGWRIDEAQSRRVVETGRAGLSVGFVARRFAIVKHLRC
jgi:hypothetical protein